MNPRDTMTPEEVREWRAKVEAGTLWPPRDWEHGTYNTYSNGRCRCADCRAANRAHMRSYVTKVRGTPPPQHGTAYAYTTYGCRCPDCTAANTETGRQYRRQRQEGKR